MTSQSPLCTQSIDWSKDRLILWTSELSGGSTFESNGPTPVIIFGNDWLICNISLNRFYYRVRTSGVILCPHNHYKFYMLKTQHPVSVIPIRTWGEGGGGGGLHSHPTHGHLTIHRQPNGLLGLVCF